MAKALVGHLVGNDPRSARETWLLRRRVADLEAEVLRLQADNDRLAAAYREARAAALRSEQRTADLEAARVLEPALH